MVERTFTTIEINKVTTWFGLPSEVQAEFVLRINKVEDRNDAILYTCFKTFEHLTKEAKIKANEEILFRMFTNLVVTVIKHTTTTTTKLPDYSERELVVLLLALLKEAQAEEKQ